MTSNGDKKIKDDLQFGFKYTQKVDYFGGSFSLFGRLMFQGTDQTMLNKLVRNHGTTKNGHFVVPVRQTDTRFGINHFAGSVLYESTGNVILTYTISLVLIA